MSEAPPPARASRRAGVLLSNLGTPDAPTAEALRRYLRQFLGDRRVVDLPRPLWRLILELFILPQRPRRSARLYKRIWTDDGSPLLVVTRRLAAALATTLEERAGRAVPVAVGMRYGRPSIASALDQLAASGCDRVLVLPLYPQYSATTTASSFDAVTAELQRRRRVPELRTVHQYHDEPAYIAALAASVREQWREHGRPDHLLVSFHGIPRAYADAGDPYPEHCKTTAVLLAAQLELGDDEWSLSYQSRFGRQEWVGPASDDEAARLAAAGHGTLHVVCPGFAVDCLETLEEIAIGLREVFLEHGGSSFRYLPALNDRADHSAALAELSLRNLQGWE